MKRDLIYGFLAIGCVCLLLGGVFWIGSEIAEKRAAQGILTINEQRELEEARRIEKEKELEEKRRQDALETERKYSQMMPYIGMSEDYISITKAGHYDYYDSYRVTVGDITTYESKYVWYGSNGRDIPLIVLCRNGMVTKIKKDYTDTYWNVDGTPCFDNPRMEKKDSHYTVSEKNYETNDMYDVYDYDDPDDFADDWAEEFGEGNYDDGYDDAYEYWEDNY